MPDQREKQIAVELEQLDTELTRSLERCRRLLFDFRSELAANSNMPGLLGEEIKEERIPNGS